MRITVIRPDFYGWLIHWTQKVSFKLKDLNLTLCAHLLCWMPLYTTICLSIYRSSIAQDMLTNLYVNNIATGYESKEEAVQFYDTAWSIIMEAQFSFRSWASNNYKLTSLVAHDKVNDGNSSQRIRSTVGHSNWHTVLSSHLNQLSLLSPPWSQNVKCWESHPRYSTHWECYHLLQSRPNFLCKSYGNAT